jgi:hypothetical protein
MAAQTADTEARTRFILDEQYARAFLARSLRRYAGDLSEGEGHGAAYGENWELVPGWDLHHLFRDDLSHVEDLIYHARQCFAIHCPPGVDIELLTVAGDCGDWSYQWRVGFEGADFAICNPYREDFRYIGHGGDPIKAKGSAAALSILREAVEYGNRLLDALAAPSRNTHP